MYYYNNYKQEETLWFYNHFLCHDNSILEVYCVQGWFFKFLICTMYIAVFFRRYRMVQNVLRCKMYVNYVSWKYIHEHMQSNFFLRHKHRLTSHHTERYFYDQLPSWQTVWPLKISVSICNSIVCNTLNWS